jgi:hypothetical protein
MWNFIGATWLLVVITLFLGATFGYMVYMEWIMEKFYYSKKSFVLVIVPLFIIVWLVLAWLM